MGIWAGEEGDQGRARAGAAAARRRREAMVGVSCEAQVLERIGIGSGIDLDLNRPGINLDQNWSSEDGASFVISARRRMTSGEQPWQSQPGTGRAS
jgi:hypothetical protein